MIDMTNPEERVPNRKIETRWPLPCKGSRSKREPTFDHFLAEGQWIKGKSEFSNSLAEGWYMNENLNSIIA